MGNRAVIHSAAFRFGRGRAFAALCTALLLRGAVCARATDDTCVVWISAPEFAWSGLPIPVDVRMSNTCGKISRFSLDRLYRLDSTRLRDNVVERFPDEETRSRELLPGGDFEILHARGIHPGEVFTDTVRLDRMLHLEAGESYSISFSWKIWPGIEERAAPFHLDVLPFPAETNLLETVRRAVSMLPESGMLSIHALSNALERAAASGSEREKGTVCLAIVQGLESIPPEREKRTDAFLDVEKCGLVLRCLAQTRDAPEPIRAEIGKTVRKIAENEKRFLRSLPTERERRAEWETRGREPTVAELFDVADLSTFRRKLDGCLRGIGEEMGEDPE